MIAETSNLESFIKDSKYFAAKSGVHAKTIFIKNLIFLNKKIENIFLFSIFYIF